MDDIISVLAIDFRPTSRRDDSYVSLCDTVHVSFIQMETAIYFRRTICQSEEHKNLDFLRILRCQENKTKRVFSVLAIKKYIPYLI